MRKREVAAPVTGTRHMAAKISRWPYKPFGIDANVFKVTIPNNVVAAPPLLQPHPGSSLTPAPT